MQQNDQHEKDYLKEMAPTLFGKKHEIPADAPKGYFDALPGKLLQRITAEKVDQPKGKIIRLINFQNIAIAAGFALLLALIPIVRHFTNTSVNSELASSNSFELKLNDDIGIDVLESYFDEEFLYASIESHEIRSWHLRDDISDVDIMNYLFEHYDPIDIITNLND